MLLRLQHKGEHMVEVSSLCDTSFMPIILFINFVALCVGGTKVPTGQGRAIYAVG